MPAVEDGAAPALVAEPIPPAPTPGLLELLAMLENCIGDVAVVVEKVEDIVNDVLVAVVGNVVVAVVVGGDVVVVVVVDGGDIVVVVGGDVVVVVVVIIIGDIAVVSDDVSAVVAVDVPDPVNAVAKEDVELPVVENVEDEDVKSELFACREDPKGSCAEVVESGADEVDRVELDEMGSKLGVLPPANVEPLDAPGQSTVYYQQLEDHSLVELPALEIGVSVVEDEGKYDVVGLDGIGVGGGDESTTCELDSGIRMDIESVAAGPEANDCDGAEGSVGLSSVERVGLTGTVTGPELGKGTGVGVFAPNSSVTALLPFSITIWATDAIIVVVDCVAYMNGGCRGTLVGKVVSVLTSELLCRPCAASIFQLFVLPPLSGLASLVSLIVLE